MPDALNAERSRRLVAAEDDGATSVAGTDMYGSRLVAVPLALALVLTLDSAAFVYAGSPWAVAAVIASAIAFLAWMRTTGRSTASDPRVFSLYIATITALVLMAAEAWHAKMPSQLMALYPDAFPAGVGIREHAFIAIFPLALSVLFVLGALAYYHDSAFGRFCAWLTFAWGLTASVSVYVCAWRARGPAHYMGGMLTAPIVLLVSAAGMRRLARGEKPADDERDYAGATRLSVALVAVFIAAYATVLYRQAGLMVVGIVCGAMVAGFVAWIRTTLRRPPRPSAILPAYLLGLALFLVHVLEEYTCDFAGRIAAAAHVQWTEAQFVEVIVLLGPAIWIAGAIGIRRRHPLGNFIAWFFFIGMILGEPAHLLVFPFLEGGRYHYFPGMWSALAPMVPAVYGIWRMLADDRDAREVRRGVTTK